MANAKFASLILNKTTILLFAQNAVRHTIERVMKYRGIAFTQTGMTQVSRTQAPQQTTLRKAILTQTHQKPIDALTVFKEI